MLGCVLGELLGDAMDDMQTALKVLLKPLGTLKLRKYLEERLATHFKCIGDLVQKTHADLFMGRRDGRFSHQAIGEIERSLVPLKLRLGMTLDPDLKAKFEAEKRKLERV